MPFWAALANGLVGVVAPAYLLAAAGRALGMDMPVRVWAGLWVLTLYLAVVLAEVVVSGVTRGGRRGWR